MRLNRYILAIDFDGTITHHDHISKSWGNRLAKKLDHLRQTYPIDIYILSMANSMHIFELVVMSGSVDLFKMLISLSLVTNDITDLEKLNYNWGESFKARKEMVRKVTHTENFHDTEYIIAYKKTNYMIGHSKVENIPHTHVFFLDDSPANVHFASYYGFQAMKIDNSKPTMTIFDRLDRIEEKLKKSFFYYK